MSAVRVETRAGGTAPIPPALAGTRAFGWRQRTPEAAEPRQPRYFLERPTLLLRVSTVAPWSAMTPRGLGSAGFLRYSMQSSRKSHHLGEQEGAVLRRREGGRGGKGESWKTGAVRGQSEKERLR